MNALKHGLTAVTVLLPGEDPDEYQTLYDGTFKDFNPLDTTETAWLDAVGTRMRLQDQRRIADDQRSIAAFEHQREVGTTHFDRRLNLEHVRAQDSDERDRRPRARVECDRSDVADRTCGVQGDRRHGAV